MLTIAMSKLHARLPCATYAFAINSFFAFLLVTAPFVRAFAQSAADAGTQEGRVPATPRDICVARRFLSQCVVAATQAQREGQLEDAAAMLRIGCDGQEDEACRLLALAQIEGRGVRSDRVSAEMLLERTCSNGSIAACGNLGQLILASGRVQTFARATDLLQRACSGGSETFCGDLARVYAQGLGTRSNPALANELDERACRAHSLDACERVLPRTQGREALEFHRHACESERGESCFIIAQTIGSALDATELLQLYLRSCTGGHAPGCSKLGELVESGDGTTADPVAAARAYERACELGAASGCGNLASAYEAGRGVTADITRAGQLYERACENGDARSCNEFGILLEDGRGVSGDPARALTFYQRACDAGRARGCENLGVAYENGRGTTRSYARAATLYESACTNGAFSACVSFGDLLEHGRGVTPDQGRATDLYRSACENRVMEGCSQYARTLEEGLLGRPDVQAAVRVYEAACNSGLQAACARFATLHVEARARPERLSRSQTASMLQRSCNSGDSLGCTGLGLAYERGHGVRKSITRAMELYAGACVARVRRACELLAGHYETGPPRLRNATSAEEHHDRACQLGSARSCDSLATLRQARSDSAGAASARQAACELRNDGDCSNPN